MRPTAVHEESGCTQADIFIKARAEEETRTLASITGAGVSPAYFATMWIPLGPSACASRVGAASSG
jgi:hypothetical protein